MNCFYCKGSFKESHTNHVVSIHNCVIVVKNVPCEECTQCGETFYSDDVATRLETVVGIIRSAKIAEVAIVNYTDEVA